MQVSQMFSSLQRMQLAIEQRTQVAGWLARVYPVTQAVQVLLASQFEQLLTLQRMQVPPSISEYSSSHNSHSFTALQNLQFWTLQLMHCPELFAEKPDTQALQRIVFVFVSF